jgi:hypothetical protein
MELERQFDLASDIADHLGMQVPIPVAIPFGTVGICPVGPTFLTFPRARSKHE